MIEEEFRDGEVVRVDGFVGGWSDVFGMAHYVGQAIETEH